MMDGLTSLHVLRRIDKCTESLAILRVLPQQSVVLSRILISYTPGIALTCSTTSRSIPRRMKHDTFNFRLCIPLLWYHTKPGWVALHETVLLIRPVSTMFSKIYWTTIGCCAGQRLSYLQPPLPIKTSSGKCSDSHWLLCNGREIDLALDIIEWEQGFL